MFSLWYDITPQEFETFLGLLLYMSLVPIRGRVSKYWSRKALYHGLWARRFMIRDRFLQIMCFLKVSDINQDNTNNDKLYKVRYLLEYIRNQCKTFFQPYRNVSIDERMVKNKGRYGFRQYIRDKPTKWGMKLWILADSITGYTCNFDVYLGRNTEMSGFGLAYDVVIKLVNSICDQGYRLFCDNFYTGVQLFKDLISKGIRACGTIIPNRKGYPSDLKNAKTFEKQANRGDIRWVRMGDLLAMQWKDSKIVINPFNRRPWSCYPKK